LPNGTFDALAVLALCLALGALVLSMLVSSWLGSSRRALRLSALGFFGLAAVASIVVGAMALFIKNPSLIDVPLFYQIRGQELGGRDLPVSLRLDPIAGLSVGVLGIVGLAFTLGLPSLFSSSHKAPKTIGVSFGALWLGALLLCVADHSLLFLFGWELWSLGFLVGIWGAAEESRRTLVVTQVGFLLLLVSFAMLSAKAGDFGISFREWRESSAVRGPLGIIGFVLMVFAFSSLFGVAPFHQWFAQATAQLPIPSVAFVSSAAPVILVCVSIRLWAESGLSESVWGIFLLIYGAFGAGVIALYSLLEKAPQRISSYIHSALLGLCLSSLGAGISGVTTEESSLAARGYTAALYYGLSAGLLLGAFRYAIELISSASSYASLEELGGLHHNMPRTTMLASLSGVALAGLPPFGVFVGFWFLLQALFSYPQGPEKLLVLVAIIGVASAVSLVLFSVVRLLSLGLLGARRSPRAEEVSESKASTRGGLLLLAISLLLGFFVGPMLGKLQTIVEGFTGKFEVPMSTIAIELNQARLAPLTLFIVVSVIGFLAFVLAKRTGSRRRAKRKAPAGDTLEGGLHADSLAQPLRYFFRSLVGGGASRVADPEETPHMSRPFEYHWTYEDRLQKFISWRPNQTWAEWLSRCLQPRSVSAYLLWIAAALFALLFLGR
jgi:formate hydrogenlyase subunit 3/multisubunit Na+/H+ antiporter MnhD subunit